MLETKRLADDGWKVVEGSRDAENYARGCLVGRCRTKQIGMGMLLAPSGGITVRQTKSKKGGKV
jgi:hypothetical protein